MAEEVQRWVTVRGRRIPIKAPTGRKPRAAVPAATDVSEHVEPVLAALAHGDLPGLRPSEARNMLLQIDEAWQQYQAAEQDYQRANALGQVAGLLHELAQSVEDEDAARQISEASEAVARARSGLLYG